MTAEWASVSLCSKCPCGRWREIRFSDELLEQIAATPEPWEQLDRFLEDCDNCGAVMRFDRRRLSLMRFDRLPAALTEGYV